MRNEDRLMRDLEQGEVPDEERNGALRARVMRERELKQKKILVACFLYCLLGIAIMFCGANLIARSDEVRIMLFGAIVVIIGFEITVLVKLGYGNAWSLVRIVQAVKEVQLDIAERTGKQDTTAG